MKFDMNGKRSRHSDPVQPTTGQNTSPAVPLSVYRELAAELQATQAMLDSLNAQNRQLRKSNQQMQLELDQIIESAQKMQQISAPAHQAKQQRVAQELQGQSDSQSRQAAQSSVRQAEKPKSHKSRHRSARPPQNRIPTSQPQPSQPIAAQQQPPTERERAVQTLNKMLTERDTPHARPKLSGEKSGELSTWWLMIMVLFIVITAFGTGFMLVRPFLSGSQLNPAQPSDSQLVNP